MNKLNLGFVTKIIGIISIITLMIIGFSMYLDTNESFSKIFNEITAGFGGLLVGIGAILAAGEWISRPKREFDLIKKNYPRKKLKGPNYPEGDFELLRTQSHGRIYLHDLRNNTNEVRWIKNWPTVEELGFNKGDWKEISDSEINGYDIGDHIIAPDS